MDHLLLILQAVRYHGSEEIVKTLCPIQELTYIPIEVVTVFRFAWQHPRDVQRSRDSRLQWELK